MSEPSDDDDRDLPRKGPDAFRTISEVAEDLGLPQHVLRFWETKFPQVRPVKRGGGRRYYRPADVELLRGVKELLYGQGYTIRGVQRILREQGGLRNAKAAGARPAPEDEGDEPSVEPGLGGASHGPDMWASGRRAAIQPIVEAPVEREPVFEREPASVAEAQPPAPARPVERRPALTESQIGRLSKALEELAACRRLLDQRS